MSSIAALLPAPLNAIVIEMRPGEYKDFGSAADYPLKGVTFASEYGYLPGYTGEDGVELDFFVGSQPDGHYGSITVFRPELEHGEHKFYAAMTDSELERTLQEYGPVLGRHEPLQDASGLLAAIGAFKNA